MTAQSEEQVKEGRISPMTREFRRFLNAMVEDAADARLALSYEEVSTACVSISVEPHDRSWSSRCLLTPISVEHEPMVRMDLPGGDVVFVSRMSNVVLLLATQLG